jgi:hypothetical protein
MVPLCIIIGNVSSLSTYPFFLAIVRFDINNDELLGPTWKLQGINMCYLFSLCASKSILFGDIM